VGTAIAGKKDGRSFHVFTLLGDGELEEGSNWEASMSAAHYGLDNLVVIVDNNGLQITGPVETVTGVGNLQQKFTAFGYAVREVNGNNISELVSVFDQVPFEEGKPNLVLAHTTKGKGISFIENQVDWHHHVPNDNEFTVAMQELDAAAEAWGRKNGNR
jgi:transketolase